MKRNRVLGLLLLVISFAVLMLVQSCECPLQESNVYSTCKVREVTITKFNPNGTLQQISNPDGTTSLVFVPESTYSIHTFLFPFDQSLSGALVNDERFANNSVITIIKVPFSDGRPYYLAILDNYPQNNNINGDILLYNVADDFSYAEIRVAGELTRINLNFNSENSTDFCEMVNNLIRDTVAMRGLKSSLSKYGENLPNRIVLNYNPSDIAVLDTGNKVVLGITPPQNDVDYILRQTLNQSINVVVRVGEVYLYKARNGKLFIFAVTDIRQGTLSPFKRRLTIMFSEVN